MDVPVCLGSHCLILTRGAAAPREQEKTSVPLAKQRERWYYYCINMYFLYRRNDP